MLTKFNYKLSSIFIITFSLNSTSFAQTNTIGALNSWAANSEDVKNAACAPQVPTDDQLLSYLGEFNKLPKSSASILGQEIQNEPTLLIEAFRRLVTKWKYDTSETPFAQQQNIKLAFNIPDRCQKIYCALEKIFSKKESLRLLYLNARYGFNASHIAFEKSIAWSAAHLDTLIQAIASFPQVTFPLTLNKRITRRTPNTRLKHHSTFVVAFAGIEFYENFLNYDQLMQIYIAFHEIAHFYSSEMLEVDESKLWLSYSGWREELESNAKGQTRTIWKSSPNKQNTFISLYGSTNPAEDFAETVAAYRFNPSLLKANSPKKYEFIRYAVFDGIEYDDKNNCEIGHHTTPLILSELQKVDPLELSTLTADQRLNLYNQCHNNISILFNDPNLLYSEIRNKIQACIENQLIQTQLHTLNEKFIDYNEYAPWIIRRMQLHIKRQKIIQPYKFSAIEPYEKASETLILQFEKLWVQSLLDHNKEYFSDAQRIKQSPLEFCKNWAQGIYKTMDSTFNLPENDGHSFFSTALDGLYERSALLCMKAQEAMMSRQRTAFRESQLRAFLRESGNSINLAH